MRCLFFLFDLGKKGQGKGFFDGVLRHTKGNTILEEKEKTIIWGGGGGSWATYLLHLVNFGFEGRVGGDLPSLVHT